MNSTVRMSGPTEARLAEPAVTEAELIVRARTGDLKAFTALVESHQARAVRAAYSFTGNFEDARDLSQEAFVKAYENLSQFKAESRFYTWFYRILSNTCKDFLRKRKVRSVITFWTGRAEDRAEQKIADVSADAGETLLNRELGEEIYRAMDRLPARQKDAFMLRYLEGLSLDEISGGMGLSVGAVKAHLWQAASKMKKYLRQYLETEDARHE